MMDLQFFSGCFNVRDPGSVIELLIIDKKNHIS